MNRHPYQRDELAAGPNQVDRAARQGEALADSCIARIRAEKSDPDALMRTLLRVMADGGYIVAPTSLLRGVCARLQQKIAGSADRATTD